MDLNAFKAWAAAKPSRSVKIEIEAPAKYRKENPDQVIAIKIWVYDYELQTGQFVESADEIDLEGQQLKKAQADLARAQKIIDQQTAIRDQAQAIIEGRTQDGHSEAAAAGGIDG